MKVHIKKWYITEFLHVKEITFIDSCRDQTVDDSTVRQ